MHIDDADANFARQTRHRLYSLFTPNHIFIYEKDVTLPACALVPVPHYRINLADSGVRRMAACPLAQEKGDTATADLKEVVVEGQMQPATAEKVTYKPSTRVKNASQNAIELLKRMAISQLNADDVAMTVKTAAGEDVSLFINYAPATPEDIRGCGCRTCAAWSISTSPQTRGSEAPARSQYHSAGI